MLNFPSYQKELGQTAYTSRPKPRTQENQYQQRVNTTTSGSLKNHIEARHYNIITQQNTRSFPHSQLPKLGQKKDFPYPRNTMNCEKNINFDHKQHNNSNNNEPQLKAITNTQFVVEPNNLMNCSSSKFNFLSLTKQNLESKTYQNLRTQHSKIASRTSQIAKITDRGRLCAPNYNQDFQETYKDNQEAFKKHKGFCADVYNRAHSYGPGIRPFRKFK